MGDMDFEGLDDGVAHTIARLSKNLNPRNYNSSGMRPGNDLVGEVSDVCESDFEEGNEGVHRRTPKDAVGPWFKVWFLYLRLP